MNVTVENLEKVFSVEKNVNIQALKDISTEIKSGEKVSIVGPSGAGKSTLLHIIGLMDRSTNGKLFLDGNEMGSLNDFEHSEIRRNKIGFLFQMHYLLHEFTVLENVLLPVWDNRGTKLNEALDILNKLGLDKRLNHMPVELSGGEQQRVSLARSLINNPRLLMADEPTGNLDRETGEIVENLIFSECKNRNITLLLVTHNTELAQKADRIMKMRDGKLLSS
ncbi:ABC transporter ATP-binding protein [Elusimicrobiota bacterium]